MYLSVCNVEHSEVECLNGFFMAILMARKYFKIEELTSSWHFAREIHLWSSLPPSNGEPKFNSVCNSVLKAAETWIESWAPLWLGLSWHLFRPIGLPIKVQADNLCWSLSFQNNCSSSQSVGLNSTGALADDILCRYNVQRWKKAMYGIPQEIKRVSIEERLVF